MQTNTGKGGRAFGKMLTGNDMGMLCLKIQNMHWKTVPKNFTHVHSNSLEKTSNLGIGREGAWQMLAKTAK